MLRHFFGQPVAGREDQVRKNLDAYGERQFRSLLRQFRDTEINGIPARWINPSDGKETGVFLYLHGGGYVVGSVRSHGGFMAEIARRSQTRVLGIDYKLAPRHPCPAAIEDVIHVYQWLMDRGEKPEAIVIAGDSAGGGLTVASLVAIRDRQLPMPAGAVLISPWLDLTLSGESLRKDDCFDYIQTKQLEEMASAKYYARELGPADPRVSPLFADLRGLPPLLVFAGEVEILLDDSRRFAEKAKEAGVDVELVMAPDEVHAYPLFSGLSMEAQKAIDRMAAFFQTATE